MRKLYRQHYTKDSESALMRTDKYDDIRLSHVSAMTGEDLHGKSEIAEELAYRDIQIVALKEKLAIADDLVDFEYQTELQDRLAKVDAKYKLGASSC